MNTTNGTMLQLLEALELLTKSSDKEVKGLLKLEPTTHNCEKIIEVANIIFKNNK